MGRAKRPDRGRLPRRARNLRTVTTLSPYQQVFGGEFEAFTQSEVSNCPVRWEPTSFYPWQITSTSEN